MIVKGKNKMLPIIALRDGYPEKGNNAIKYRISLPIRLKNWIGEKFRPNQKEYPSNEELRDIILNNINNIRVKEKEEIVKILG